MASWAEPRILLEELAALPQNTLLK